MITITGGSDIYVLIRQVAEALVAAGNVASATNFVVACYADCSSYREACGYAHSHGVEVQ